MIEIESNANSGVCKSVASDSQQVARWICWSFPAYFLVLLPSEQIVVLLSQYQATSAERLG